MKSFLMIASSLLLTFSAIAQTTVKGRVTNDEGLPLIGANVLIAETQQGTATNTDGYFEIVSVKEGAYSLQVSYIGYYPLTQNIEVKANDVLELDIQLGDQPVQVATLTVKATRAGNTTPMTYTNLSAEDIDAQNLGQDVPFVLRWTPSAVVTSDAGAGIGYTGIRIRGTDPTRINVTINGIPLNDAESQGVFWVDLPDFASSASDIQIQRGVGTSTNGAGAFGATINLNTSQLRSEAYAEFNGSIGSFNTQKANVQFGTGLINGKFAVDGRLSRITSDGYIDRATADLSSYYLSGAYFGKKSSLRLNLFSGHEETYQAWNGVPASNLDDADLRTYNSAGTEKEGTPHDNEVDNYGQDHYQLLYDYQLNRNWALNASLHYTKGKGYFEQYKADEALTDYGLSPLAIGDSMIMNTDLIRRRWLDNDYYGGIYALNYQSDDNRIDFTLGGGYHVYDGLHFGEIIWAEYASDSEKDQRYYENDALKTDFNIYGRINYGLLENLSAYLDLQYRRVEYEFLGFDSNLENVEQEAELNFFNPKAGLLYQLSDQASLYTSFAVANREPNRNDYVESSADSRPEPETLYDIELGYRYTSEKAALEAVAYYMYYIDQLALNGQINDVGASTRVNIDKSYRLGIELAGGIQLASFLRFDANLTLSQNKVDAFTEYVDVYDENFSWIGQQAIEHADTDLSFSPSVIAGGGPTLELLKENKLHDLSLSWLTKYVSKQYIDNTSDDNNVIDAYSFTDLRLRYEWQTRKSNRVALTFLTQNLFDSFYETNAWSYRYIFDGTTAVDQGYYPQAGRNYMLGLTIGI
ncbi:MAG: TonB-dependent receptor [Chitinophagales bacterium]|nr:TonB-dependent receptor [Chitinophagales bacterium]